MTRYCNLFIDLVLVNWVVCAQSLQRLKDFHQKLTRPELDFVFGVGHHNDVPEYDLFYPQKLSGWSKADQTRELSFEAMGEHFRLYLRPHWHRLLSPDLITVVRDKNDTRVSHGVLPRQSECHFVGEAVSHGNLSATVSACTNLRGAIVFPDHFLMFNPVPRRFHQENKSQPIGLHEIPHVIYKRSASLAAESLNNLPMYTENVVLQDFLNQEFCDVRFNFSVPRIAMRDSLYIFPNLDPLTLEIALFLDSKLYDHFREEFSDDHAEEELTHFALALINNVHVLYNQPSMEPKMEIVIVRFEIWKQQRPGMESHKHKSGHAQLMLDAFCQYQLDSNPGTDLGNSGHWDHAIMLTGYDLYHTTSSVAGVAPVARMCDASFSCSLVEGRHLGRSYVLAHEMGHNLGMVHDGAQNQCSRSCCLMSAVNGAGKTTWSPCSVRELNAYVLSLGSPGAPANCLTDGALGVSNRDHRTDSRLPGQRFTSDQQCSFFWGRDYSQEVPAGRHIEDICHILWCGNTGSTISTAHPALEGTWCGGQKWCRSGRCEDWPAEAGVQVVDGDWSAWARRSRSHCSECKANGGIRLRTERRYCDNPAPNNGGRLCSGSNVRGLVCTSAPHSSCTGFSRQQFGDRLCKSFKSDPTQPDRQLSGKSYLHPTSPCKVWCHLSGSDLIRNKAQYPDGTPCDDSKGFCVSGTCMQMTCGNQAVVSDEADCPSSSGASQGWSIWSGWSECSVTCGLGYQTRNRLCTSAADVGSCPGARTEGQQCNETPCASWGTWSDWSQCSATCGSGHKLRSRICSNGVGCAGSSIEQAACALPLCTVASQWSVWSGWSSCSATCGSGVITRNRACSTGTGCYGNTAEQTTCYLNNCLSPSWSRWTAWTSCSRSCNRGRQTRDRDCINGPGCLGINQQEQYCNKQKCPSWGIWASWSACTETCGYGFSTRFRHCLVNELSLCVGAKEETRRCNLQHCNDWSPWSQWSDCSRSCGPGIRRRTRNCPPGNVCQGNDLEDSHCETQSCLSWSEWDSWQTCSVTCGSGTETRSRTCAGVINTVLITDKGQTKVPKDIHGKTCPGEGAQVRGCQRPFCPAALSATTARPRRRALNWQSWSSWGSCSVTCESGHRQRTRTCPNSWGCPGIDTQKLTCRVGVSCDSGTGIWSVWEAWTQCSAFCGSGTRQRVRYCQNGLKCVPKDGSVTREHCNTHACNDLGSRYPEWSTWSVWSGCSCFKQSRVRRRYCRVYEPQILGFCLGPMLDEQSCSPDPDCTPVNGGWTSWSSWSSCSSDCGSRGNRIRYRVCSNPFPINRGSNCKGKSFDKDPCSALPRCQGVKIDGQWSNWTTWSSCSAPCGRGHRSRTRHCNSPRPSNGGIECKGADFDMERCSGQSCASASIDGQWIGWSSWSPCTQTCGFAFQKRYRHCNGPPPAFGGKPCKGLAHMTRLCDFYRCPNSVNGGWNSWSQWSACTINCGFGEQTRSRHCNSPQPAAGGFPCFGASASTRRCTDFRETCMNPLTHIETMERLIREFEMYYD